MRQHPNIEAQSQFASSNLSCCKLDWYHWSCEPKWWNCVLSLYRRNKTINYIANVENALHFPLQQIGGTVGLDFVISKKFNQTSSSVVNKAHTSWFISRPQNSVSLSPNIEELINFPCVCYYGSLYRSVSVKIKQIWQLSAMLFFLSLLAI